jgi:hypothetical protein
LAASRSEKPAETIFDLPDYQHRAIGIPSSKNQETKEKAA